MKTIPSIAGRLLLGVLVCLTISGGLANGSERSKKYTREFNEKGKHFDKVAGETYDPDFRSLQRPFRMAKLNLVWSKAQNVGPSSFPEP